MFWNEISPVILFAGEFSGLFGSISVFRSSVSKTGVKMFTAEITVGIRVHSSVIDGTVKEKIWYDRIPSSKLACFFSTRTVEYHNATA